MADQKQTVIVETLRELRHLRDKAAERANDGRLSVEYGGPAALEARETVEESHSLREGWPVLVWRGDAAPAVASSGAEGGERPPVTVICGSTRFLDEIADAERRLTAAGHVVIGLGPVDCDDATPEHEAVHRRKIDVADGIYVVNPGGYVGESTAREIAYARETGKSVAQLYPEPGPSPDDDGQAYLDYEIDREADRLLEEETRAEVRAAFPPEEAPDAR